MGMPEAKDGQMLSIENKNILIVDDTASNLDLLVYALGNSYDVRAALDAASALEAMEDFIPDLILLDVMMPDMNGFELCEKLKADSRFTDIPIIFLTVMDQISDKTKGFDLGAVDYIIKPFEIPEVKARVKTHLQLHEAKSLLSRQNDTLEERIQERTRQLVLTQNVAIQSLAILAETRDNETGNHIYRTQNYIRILTETLKEEGLHRKFLTDRTMDLLVKSATLHDIGKVGIPDGILLKPGKLTSEEFEMMKQHTVLGKKALVQAEMDLGSNCFLEHGEKFAYSHHEKWDGTGYPGKIAGAAIPLEGRLMAVADVFDALISSRVYKPPYPFSQACAIIFEGSGSHFDPALVGIFGKSREKFRSVALKFCDSEKEREALYQ